jgi:hypothetical protein
VRLVHAISFAVIGGFSFWVAGCDAGQSPANTAHTVRDSAGVAIVEHSADALPGRPLEIIDSAQWRIGARSGEPEHLFSRVAGGVRTEDGDFVVLDRAAREARVFDSSGRFLRRIGRAGPGPGEFREPARLVLVNGDEFLVWDAAAEIVTRFDTNGEVISSERVAGGGLVDLAVLPTDAMVLVHDEPPAGTGSGDTERIRNAGRLVGVGPPRTRTIAEFSGTEWELRRTAGGMAIRRPWFLPRLLTGVSKDGLWISYGVGWELTRRRLTDGDIDRIVRFDIPPEPFDAELIRQIHSVELDALQSTDERQAAARRQEYEEYPSTVPAIADVLVDAIGRLWVGRMDAPPQSLPSGMGPVIRRWIVLDEGGTSIVGTVSLPPGRRLLHADSTGVLLLTVDEVDVPYVEWWTWQSAMAASPTDNTPS